MSQDTPEQLFADSPADGAVNAAILGIGALVVLVIVVIAITAMWKLFSKAGEPGWKSLIPVYSSWVFLRLGNQAGWWALVAFIPFVNIVSAVFMIIAAYNIALKLGKESWYVVLYILLPLVWMLILGFDKSTWKENTAGIVPSPLGGDSNPQPAYVPPAEQKPVITDTDTPETKPPIQL